MKDFSIFDKNRNYTIKTACLDTYVWTLREFIDIVSYLAKRENRPEIKEIISSPDWNTYDELVKMILKVA